jgi:hypothetical protein
MCGFVLDDVVEPIAELGYKYAMSPAIMSSSKKPENLRV